MTIGWALLGPGSHAERNVLPQMGKAKDSNLVAVFSRDAARGADFARKHGFARSYISLAETLADPAVDAVYDATPDGLHLPNTVLAAAAGKHILIEKPLAISIDECLQAIAVCQKHGVKLGVVFQQRHDAVHREARRLVQAGEIGEVVLARVQLAMRLPGRSAAAGSPDNWRADPAMRPGGIVMGAGDHAYDTLAYITGQEIEEVFARTDSTQESPPNEQIATVLLRLSGGGAGIAGASRQTPYGQEPMVIHGSEGSLSLHNTYNFMVPPPEGDPTPRLELTNAQGRTARVMEQVEAFKLEFEQFNRFIQGEGPPMTSAREGLVNQAITEAIYLSAESGRSVKVAELLPAGF